MDLPVHFTDSPKDCCYKCGTSPGRLIGLCRNNHLSLEVEVCSKVKSA